MAKKRRSNIHQELSSNGVTGAGLSAGVVNTADTSSTTSNDSDKEDNHHQQQCMHIKKSIQDIHKVKKYHAQLDTLDKCYSCNNDDVEQQEEQELVMCMWCGKILCTSIHSPHHQATPHSDSHCITIHMSTYNIYCHLCNTQLSNNYNYTKLSDMIEYVKKITPSSKIPPPPPPPSPPASVARSPVPLMSLIPAPAPLTTSPSSLSRIRGLSNLGNTCFFNSVLQCLVQTPYLVEVLRQMSDPGETFTLPGGTVKINTPAEDPDSKPVQTEELLPPIDGELEQWGTLTKKLANTLQELQNSVTSGVYNPRDLHSVLTKKLTQFYGGDQHDSHELLRHLLEGVRSEDLKRYRRVILNKLGLPTNIPPSDVDEITKQKIKFYDQQVSDKMLRPEQVFRGFLVSTLECQECGHTSDRSEYFLDLSLPVVADKPQPPALQRRKGQDVAYTGLGAQDESKPTKHQLKKEKQAAKKAARKNKKAGLNQDVSNKVNADGSGDQSESLNKSSSEHSDADCEDNVEETNSKPQKNNSLTPMLDTAANFGYYMESGYNSDKLVSSDSIRASPVELDQKEKSDSPPKIMDETSVVPVSPCLSAIAIPLDYRPLSMVKTPSRSNPDSGVSSPETAKHTLSDAINGDSPVSNKELESPLSTLSHNNSDNEPPFMINYVDQTPEFGENKNESSSNLEIVSDILSDLTLENNVTDSTVPPLTSPNSESTPSYMQFLEQYNSKVEKSENSEKSNNILDETIPPPVTTPNIDSYMQFLENYNPPSSSSSNIDPIKKLKDTTIPPSLIGPELDPTWNNMQYSEDKPSTSGVDNVSKKLTDMTLNNSTSDATVPPPLNSPDMDSWGLRISPFVNRPYSISQRYQNDNEGYSVQSCLNNFTLSELLMGNNKVGCEACTKRVNGENGKTVYTNATKRFLISSPPAILILHLKRFQFGSRYMLSKLTKHVNFSTLLDLNPFCSEGAKQNVDSSQKDLKNIYSLYGVVEHCGGMHSGHYVAYVKVRPHVSPDDKRWSFLPTGDNMSNGQSDTSSEIGNGNDDTSSSLSGYESGEGATAYPEIESPPGKWYYASDSSVHEVTEEAVLKAKAYLLFYERIL